MKNFRFKFIEIEPTGKRNRYEKFVIFREGGLGKALTMTMTPFNLTNGQKIDHDH